MAGSLSGGERISLLVSDIDGTLVTDSKVLTPATLDAAEQLRASGVKLSLVSSRPPMGFSALAEALRLEAPIGAFNGGAILSPHLEIIEATLVPASAARTAIDVFAAHRIDTWLMTADTWYALHADGDYVPKERRTIGVDPVLVGSFEPLLGRVGKLVGSSSDFARVAECEAVLQQRLGGTADAKRSQPYYLDVTPAGFDKGVAAKRIAGLLGIPLDEVAVIGDMANDEPMFDVAPFRIAMGNGIEALKARASYVTSTNENDGFARAVREFVLQRAPRQTPITRAS